MLVHVGVEVQQQLTTTTMLTSDDEVSKAVNAVESYVKRETFKRLQRFTPAITRGRFCRAHMHARMIDRCFSWDS